MVSLYAANKKCQQTFNIFLIFYSAVFHALAAWRAERDMR
jgi:hypothetical protein